MFRRYSPVQGRWISPDPAGMAAVDPTNPQTWNRYAYVMNNPLAYVDPLGLEKNNCILDGAPSYCSWVSTGGGSGPGGGGGIPVFGTASCYSENEDGGYVPCTVLIGYAPSFGGGGAGGGGANNGNQPKQTKQQCIDNFLKTGYGPAGNFMAKTGVPSFSAISIFTNTVSWLKGEGLSILAKGVVSGAPIAYGKILTTTGSNMAAYPGTAAAGADIAETG